MCCALDMPVRAQTCVGCACCLQLFETATQHMLIWVLVLRARDAVNEHGPTAFSPHTASVSNLCDQLIGHACFHSDVALNLHDAFLASTSLVSALVAEPRPVSNSAAHEAGDDSDAMSESSDAVSSGSEADEELPVPAAAAAGLAEVASGSSIVTAYQCALFHCLSAGMQDAARSSGIVASVPVLLDAYLASLAALKAREATAITGRTAAATLRRDRRGDVVAAARKFSMFLELCLVVAPELRGGVSTPLSVLALRAVRYLLMAAARHRLYSISDDVAPHPQLCCLKRISSVAGLGDVFSTLSGDVLTARIGVAMQVLPGFLRVFCLLHVGVAFDCMPACSCSR
jgi:hypothetical protein